MAKMQVTKDGQPFLYFPVALMSSLGWGKGTIINFEIRGKGKLKLEEVKNGTKDKDGSAPSLPEMP